jgi:erythromycin esterase-like protein
MKIVAVVLILLLHSFNICAQDDNFRKNTLTARHMNFGFDSVDVESLPVNWIYDNSAPKHIVAKADLKKTHGDGATLHISRPGADPFSEKDQLLVYQRVPLIYKLTRLSVATDVYASSMTHDDYKIVIWFLDINGNVIRKVVAPDSGIRADGWASLKIDAEIPEGSMYFVPAILFKGKGEIWVSKLSVNIGNNDIVSRTADKSVNWQQQFVKQRSEPARDTAILPVGYSGNRERFLKEVAGKRVVALGEYCHGSAETLLENIAICKSLIANEGFNCIILEAGMDACRHLDAYIKGEEDNESTNSFKLVGFHLHNRQVYDFLLWLKEYNSTHKEKISLHGMDMQVPFYSLQTLEGYFEKDTLLLDALKKIDDYEMQKFTGGSADPGDVNDLDKHLQQQFRTVNLNLLPVTIRQDLELVMQFVTNESRLQLNPVKNRTSFSMGVGSYRDTCMAKNVLSIVSMTPGTKAIVIGHNGHIAGAKGTVGGYLRKALGKDFTNIGFIVGGGNYFSYWDFNAEHQVNATIPVAPPLSVEYALKSHCSTSAYIMMHKVSAPLHDLFASPQVFNILGMAQKEAYNFAFCIVPADDYDNLIFIEDTHPTDVLSLDFHL